MLSYFLLKHSYYVCIYVFLHLPSYTQIRAVSGVLLLVKRWEVFLHVWVFTVDLLNNSSINVLSMLAYFMSNLNKIISISPLKQVWKNPVQAMLSYTWRSLMYSQQLLFQEDLFGLSWVLWKICLCKKTILHCLQCSWSWGFKDLNEVTLFILLFEFLFQ